MHDGHIYAVKSGALPPLIIEMSVMITDWGSITANVLNSP
jgi:hypothetical protein